MKKYSVKITCQIETDECSKDELEDNLAVMMENFQYHFTDVKVKDIEATVKTIKE